MRGKIMYIMGMVKKIKGLLLWAKVGIGVAAVSVGYVMLCAIGFLWLFFYTLNGID
jgi:hypothetical protein